MLARRDRLSTIGVRRSRRLGTDNEFERLRDYIEGDDPRHMDWRATARRRKLTCRAFQVNQSQRIIFLIDCGRMMAGDTGDGLSPLDHAFNAMLLLGPRRLDPWRPGGLAGLLRPRPRLCPAGGRPAADQAARAQRAQRLPRHGRAPLRPGFRRAGEAVPQAVAGRPDDESFRRGERADSLATIYATSPAATCRWRCSSATTISSPWPISPLGRPAALPRRRRRGAARTGAKRVLAGLRQGGVLTLDVFPEELTAPLVNRYLEIKARHCSEKRVTPLALGRARLSTRSRARAGSHARAAGEYLDERHPE